MDSRELKIYTDIGNGVNNPSFKGLSLTEYTFKAPRMGSPELTATLRYETALDNEWTHKEYVTVRGEKYYIFNTPESKKDNTSGLYVHSLSFVSERDVILTNVLFYDTVEGYSSSVDKPYSNNTKVTFYGTLSEFVDRMNCAFLYAGVADSCLLTNTSPSKADVAGDGYVAVIGDGDGDVDKTEELSFEDKYIWEAITEVYNKFKVPFKFIGKVIEWNPVEGLVDYVFEYGHDKSLKSVSHANAKARIINRITAKGSSENIPHYYPNETEYGNIKLTFDPDNLLFDSETVKIVKPTLLVQRVRVEDTIEGIDHNSALAWKVGDKIYSDIASLGLEIQWNKLQSAVTDIDFIGEKIQWDVLKRIPFQDHLMPPKYRASLGEERFYNALNNTYKVPETESYYFFNNPYVQGFPREYIHTDEEIKPTIEGIRNDILQSDGKGQLFGQIAAVAFDDNDNDNLIEANDEGDATKYQHPYFYIKLHKFSGDYGFDLFKSASQADPMTIQVTSGPCNGCKFKVVCIESTNDDGYKTFQNPIQVDSSGNMIAGDWQNKLSGTNIIESQQNTETNSIWIAVQKDIETFGDIMPSAMNNYKPKAGDTFNIINIDLPQGYILAAEKRLEEAAIKYMSENNDEKFTFAIQTSAIFIEDNPTIATQLSEYAKIKVKYNGTAYELYISSYTVQYGKEALPTVSVDLTDTLSVGSSFVQEVARQAVSLLPTATGYMRSTDAERRYISKVRNDRTPFALTVGGKLTAEADVSSKEFLEGLVGKGYHIDQAGNIYADSLTLRKFLEVPELRYNRTEVINGTVWHAPGGGIVETASDSTNTFVLKLEDGEAPALAVGDFCMGIWHFGNGMDATADSDSRNGNITFKGFTTVYFKVQKIQQSSSTGKWTVTYTMRGGQWSARPQAGLHFVAYGNDVDTTRQRSRYATRSYEYYLSDVKNWTFSVNNIMMAFGDLSGVIISGTNMSGYSAYLSNVYFSGVIQKLETAPLQIDLDSQGVNYLGAAETCQIICRAIRGVDVIDPADITWEVKTSTNGPTPAVNTQGIINVTYATLDGKDEVEINVRGTLSVNGVPYSDERSIIIKDKALMKGADGITIKSTTVTYQASTSGTVVPTGTWLTTIPSVPQGQYLWTRTVTTYSDNTSTTAYSVSRQGINGTNGTNGVGIADVTNKYAVNNSSTTVPTIWQESAPTMTPTNRYLWNYEIITYTNGTTSETDKRVIGVYGQDGSNGKGISTITEHYLATTANSGVTTSTSGWTTTIQTITNTNKYLWNYETITYSDGTSTNSTPVIIGVYGDQGIKGADGRGVVSTTITYQLGDSGTTPPTGTWSSNVPPLTKGKYLWTRSITTYTTGNPTTLYSVSYVAKDGTDGTDGLPGKDGVGITSTTVTYAKSTSNTVVPTSGWQSTIPNVPAGQYLWTKTVWTYSDNTTETGYSVARQGDDGTSVTITSTSVTYAKTTTPNQPDDSQFTLTSIGTLTKGTYLWTKTEVHYSDGVSTKSYAVSYIGADGTDGQPGAPGTDGRTPYVHFAYASAITGSLPHPTSVTGFSTTSFDGAKYIGICTNYTVADPTTNVGQTYEWSEYKGADGQNGASYTDNKLLNSQFKTEQHWEQNGTMDIANVYRAIKLNGNNSLRLYRTGATSDDYQGVYQANIAVLPSKTYTVSIWTYAPNASSVNGEMTMMVQFQTSGTSTGTDYPTSMSIKPSSSGVWRQHFFTTKAPSNAKAMTVVVVFSRNGDVLLSSPKVEEGTNTSPVWTPNSSEIQGEDGKDAVMYQWMPNVQNIHDNGDAVSMWLRPSNYKAELRMITGTQITSIGTPDGHTCVCRVKGKNTYEGTYTPNTAISTAIGTGLIGLADVDEIVFELWTADKSTLVATSSINVIHRGITGMQGPTGGVMRIRGEWESTVKYYAEDEAVDGVRYVDIVYITANNGARSYWGCKKTNTGQTPAEGSTYWEHLSDLGSLYANMIFAPLARIEFLSGQEIVISDSQGNITGRIGTGDVPIFMGGEKAGTATYALGKSGETRYGINKGQRIDITPQDKTIKIYNEKGALCTTLSGENKTRAELTGNATSSWASTTNATGGVIDNATGGQSVTKQIGTLTVTTSGSVNIKTSLEVKANEAKMISSSSASDPNQLIKASASIALRVNDKNDETVLYKPYSVESNWPGEGENLLTVPIDENLPVSTNKSTYKVYIEMSVTDGGGQVVAYSKYGAVSVSSVTAAVYKAELFANGMCYSRSSSDYVMAITESDSSGMMFEAQNQSGYGIRCTQGGVQMRHHGSGVWRSLPEFLFKARINFNSSGNVYAVQNAVTFDDVTISVGRTGTGIMNITFPGWYGKGISIDNMDWVVNVNGTTGSDGDNVSASTWVSNAGTAITLKVKLYQGTYPQDASFFISAYLQR